MRNHAHYAPGFPSSCFPATTAQNGESNFHSTTRYRLAWQSPLVLEIFASQMMQDPLSWQASKFVKTASGWVGSPDPSQLGIGSRLIGDILADVYFRAIQTHARGRLLDLGCGDVPLYGMYRDLVTENMCIDWEQSLHPNRHIDQFVNLNGVLPIADEEFDTILSTDVLEHIARPDCALAEMCRVLRPGGKLVLTTPFFYWLHEEPHDYHRYTAHKLRLFCADYGLDIVELNPYGGAPEVLLDIVSKLLLFRHPRLAALFVYLSRLLLRRAWVGRLSESTRSLFPLGYCLVARKPERLSSYRQAHSGP